MAHPAFVFSLSEITLSYVCTSEVIRYPCKYPGQRTDYLAVSPERTANER